MERQVSTRTSEQVAHRARRAAKRPAFAANDGAKDILLMQQRFGNQAVQQRAATCAAFSSCPTGGACHPCLHQVQTKRHGHQPDDLFEQEADRVAETVMQRLTGKTPGRTSISRQVPIPQIQRMCIECEEEMNAEPEDTGSHTKAPEMMLKVAPVRETEIPTETVSSFEPTTNEPEAGVMPTPAPAEATPEAEAVSAAPALTLVVEDSAEELGTDQMRKSEYLAEVRTEVCRTVEEMIAPTGRSTEDCPYLEFVFGFLSRRSAEYLNQTLHQFVPNVSSITTARDSIPIITERVRQSTEMWLETGQITGLPENVPTGLIRAALTAGSETGAPSAEKVSFKGKEGEAREPRDPQAIRDQLGAGRSLDSRVKSRMESAFGYNFSSVRMHTDSTAGELSRSLNARAFTVGEHIAFGSGEYQPDTLIGDALIAHELAHVVQQGNGNTNELQSKGGTEYTALEEDADVSAVGAVVSIWGSMKGFLKDIGKEAMPRLRTGLQLQRCAVAAAPAAAGAAGVSIGLTDILIALGLATAVTTLESDTPRRRGRWICEAQCNVQQIRPDANCPDRVYGTGFGSSQEEACREAKRAATQSTPEGCYPRHCRCFNCQRT